MLPIALSILGALAPHAGSIIGGLAGLLGGPKAEDVAKSVVDKATSVFGTSDPEQIKLLIARDQGMVQRYLAEVQAETEQYRIQTLDIQNARARDLSIRAMADGTGVPAGTNRRANVMLIGVFVMLIAILVGTLLYRSSIPDTVMAMLSMIAGNLVGNLTQAFNFEFGSSRGSSEKSTTISNMAESATNLSRK